MLQLFFLQEYIFPTDWNSQCSTGVVNGDSGKGYSTYDKDRNLYGTFCPDSDSSLQFKGYTDKTSWWIKTDSGSRSGGCNKDGSYGCCNYDTTVTGFHAHKCYPFYSHHQANCDGETDKNEIIHNGGYLYSASYTCSNYDDCKGYYWGPNCQNKVDAYDRTTNCEVFLGVTGNGSCKCWSKTIQQYCRPGTTGINVQLFKREKVGDTWVYQKDLTSVSFTTDDTYYYQYYIAGYIIIPDPDFYTFQFKTKTPATIKLDTTTKGASNYLNCDPYFADTQTFTVQKKAAQPIRLEIVIDSGCSLNHVEVELLWKYGTVNFYTIPNNYLYH